MTAGRGDAKALLGAIAGFVAQPKSPQLAAQDRAPKIGTVDLGYAGTNAAKVQFDGETAVSTKAYVVIGTPPLPGARVQLIPSGKTYVIIGTLGAAGVGSLPNLLTNGELRINQRAYVSALALAVGAYGLDRWASSTANSSMTFSAIGAQSTTVTINSGGSFKQTVERVDVEPGTYTLAWVGGASARVYNVGAAAPSYQPSPVTVTLDGTADVAVEVAAVGAARTLAAVQLVAGLRVPGAVEHLRYGDELRRAQRYYQRVTSLAAGEMLVAGGMITATLAFMLVLPIVTMRTTPTCNIIGAPQLYRPGQIAPAAASWIAVGSQSANGAIMLQGASTSGSADAPCNMYASAAGQGYELVADF
jgi:hypothetical protein